MRSNFSLLSLKALVKKQAHLTITIPTIDVDKFPNLRVLTRVFRKPSLSRPPKDFLEDSSNRFLNQSDLIKKFFRPKLSPCGVSFDTGRWAEPECPCLGQDRAAGSWAWRSWSRTPWGTPAGVERTQKQIKTNRN